MRRLLLIALFLLVSVSARAGEVERLYVIDCGFAHAEDQSLWSPGVNVGVPIDFSDNCYLIRHSSEGYLLWDTGITDRLAALRLGQAAPPLRQTWYRSQPLVAELATIGVKPGDIHYVAISHIHPDHIGNVDAFPDATLIMQRHEWEAAMALPQRPFGAEQKSELLDGDKDLFGDGSLTILSTPGHTAGHPIAARSSEQDRLCVVDRRCRPFSIELGQPESSWFQRRSPDVAGLDGQARAHRG
jgi:N-acyl homoserine lactone hydrolase